jgi:plastocyanin
LGVSCTPERVAPETQRSLPMPPIAAKISLLTPIITFVACCAIAQTPDASIDWTKADIVTVTVTMADYTFSPRRVTFRRSVPTRLRLVNIGTELHDFTASDFFKTVDLRDPSVMGSSGIGITVEPHQEKDVDFIARLPGHFGLICADHDWAGMTADIFVE